MRIPFLKRKKMSGEIYIDEIFLDSHNSPEFNSQQFEGKLEAPISKRIIIILGSISMLFAVLFLYRLFDLQIVNGADFRKRSDSNSLWQQPLFAERGIIFDRRMTELAWNIPNENGDPYPERAYTPDGGFSHLLGYILYPKSDDNGFYWQTDTEGKDGIEKVFDEYLKGENGVTLFETDVSGEVLTSGSVKPALPGHSITLTIDSRLQKKLSELISKNAVPGLYEGGAGVIMDVTNGDIIAMTSYPEYNSNILTNAKDRSTITEYVNDERHPFLNRALSGLYTPGSIVKPYIALGALTEGVTTPETIIISNGQIEVANPYAPGSVSVFKDNKAHGPVDIERALAVSSNIYFYAIGGGFEKQVGLGIDRINKYLSMFGLGEKTGINLPGESKGTIPSPEWKAKTFPGDQWRIGDTYNTAIGQYGFQVTPLQMARAVSAVANGGKLQTPNLILSPSILRTASSNLEVLPVNSDAYPVVREGMRRAVTEGRAILLSMNELHIAAKTGTAQLGVKKDKVNSWVSGFFPYENPRYAFILLMEAAPNTEPPSATSIIRPLFDSIVREMPEYLN